MKHLYRITVPFSILTACYLAGPRPPKPVLNATLPVVPVDPHRIVSLIREREQVLPVKPGNESLVVWADDSLKTQTDYCLLYLHGFSASGYEGYPTHINFARHFGINAYIPRLAFHGLDEDDPLIGMTPDSLYGSAKEALQIAGVLGKKVILMSTSTGGTLSLKLAAEFPDRISGLLLLSPNVRINNPAAFALSGHWGLTFARAFYRGKYRVTNADPTAKECRYWYCRYRLEAIVYLQQLVNATMKKRLFGRVHTPVFLAYYYKDKTHQDPVVRVDAMLKMFNELGTPSELKQKQAFNAGTHTIGCEATSKTRPEVEQACIGFAETVMGLQGAGNGRVDK